MNDTTGLILTITIVALVIFALVVAAYWLWQNLPDWKKRRKAKHSKHNTPDPEVGVGVMAATHKVARLLNDIERDTTAARAQAALIEEAATCLANMVVDLVREAHDMHKQAETMKAVVGHVQADNVAELDYHVGYLNDPQLSALLAAGVLSISYKTTVLRALAAQSGALDRWCERFDEFAARLGTELTTLKVRLTDIQNSGRLLEVAPTLLTAQLNVLKAESHLGMAQNERNLLHNTEATNAYLTAGVGK